MRSPPILVTGGAGFIGSHTCKALRKAGYLPLIVDLKPPPSSLKACPYFLLNLQDPSSLEEVFKRFQPIAVFHFAAFTSVAESVKFPDKFYQNNVVGSLNLLRACVKYQVRNFVFSSSAAVYGIPTQKVLTEKKKLAPISPYGNTKKIVEELLQDLDQAYGMKSVSLRYFNAAGADPEGDLGEDHEPETHLIPLAIEAALTSGKELCIFGKDYPTQDGTAIRDYIHVSDLAQAHILALEYLKQKGETTQINLGTSQGFSVQEICKEIEKQLDRKIPIQLAPRRKGDPPFLVASSEKAKKLLGFYPQYSELSFIIKTAISWSKKK